MASSDRPFKLAHADPRLVEDVVRLVATQWADRLDYDALVAVDKEYVAREQRNRGELQALIQDRVWRAPLKDGAPLANGERPYVDIVLEFQSAVDRRMAWRMADCLHALRLNQRESGVAEREGRLPDVLSVVVHNGARAWDAPATLPGPLVGPPTAAGRARNAVRLYELVDYATLAAERDLFGLRLPPDGPLATLVELETAPPGELARRLRDAFLRHPDAGSAGLRRALHARVRHMLRRHGLDVLELSYYENRLRQAQRGGKTMPTLMEATWDAWFEEHDAQISAQAREQGLTQGREQGLTQGREQGLTQGLAEGSSRMLRRLAERRFGARTAERLSALLSGVATDRLAEVGDWMLACETGDELLERVGSLRAPGGRAARHEPPSE